MELRCCSIVKLRLPLHETEGGRKGATRNPSVRQRYFYVFDAVEDLVLDVRRGKRFQNEVFGVALHDYRLEAFWAVCGGFGKEQLNTRSFVKRRQRCRELESAQDNRIRL